MSITKSAYFIIHKLYKNFKFSKKHLNEQKFREKKVSERVDLVEAGPSEIPERLKTIVSVVDAVPSEPPGNSKQVFGSICL